MVFVKAGRLLLQDIVILGNKRKYGESDNQNTQPEGDDTGCKELYVLIIVPFHVHGWILLDTGSAIVETRRFITHGNLF